MKFVDDDDDDDVIWNELFHIISVGYKDQIKAMVMECSIFLNG